MTDPHSGDPRDTETRDALALSMTPFQCANRILGHGEPENGVWFIGEEYADGYQSMDGPLGEFRKTNNTGIYPPDGKQQFKGPKGVSIRHLTARILYRSSVKGRQHLDNHGWYLKNCLWQPCSGTFQANLFPLGKAGHDAQLSDVDRQILGGSHNQYLDLVRSDRFPRLREHWDRSRKQVAICFGSGEWPLFKELFGVRSDAVPERLAGGKIEIYQGNIILVPFLSWWRGGFYYSDADVLGTFLVEKVRLALY